jgi:hypothetical protein
MIPAAPAGDRPAALTLVVAEFGMLLAFLWLLPSPVRGLRVLPTLDPAHRQAAPG